MFDVIVCNADEDEVPDGGGIELSGDKRTATERIQKKNMDQFSSLFEI